MLTSFAESEVQRLARKKAEAEEFVKKRLAEIAAKQQAPQGK